MSNPEGYNPELPENINARNEALEFNKLADTGQVTTTELSKKLIKKDMSPEVFMEYLKAFREAEILLTLASQPGACVHISRNGYPYVPFPKRVITEWEKWDTERQEFMSLSVANGEGISSMVASEYNWRGRNPGDNDDDEPRGVGGFILKPEFLLEKLAASEMTLEQLNQKGSFASLDIHEFWDTFRLAEGLLLVQAIKEEILNNGDPVYISGRNNNLKNAYVIDGNSGIRSARIVNGQVVAVDILPSDVECCFSTSPVKGADWSRSEEIGGKGTHTERIKFFHPDGKKFSDEELKTLHEQARKEKIWDRYYDYFDIDNGWGTYAIPSKKLEETK